MIIVAVKKVSPTISVPLCGADLYIVDYHGQPYVPIKPIAEGMGLNWASQFTKLKTRFQQVEKISIPTKHGLRTMSCLALDELADWLDMINPRKVKAAIRNNVVWYQEECHGVLSTYWIANEEKRKAPVRPQPCYRFLVKMEVHDRYLNKTDIFTGRTETPENIITGVARQYGYYIENMISLPMHRV
ncbi:phage antirepressor N-terminal domain-containing protein [Xenorhabdus poinarii]|uniref:phage antirepressor N-terminal domain-containing protein n=1 Tax=Xenorhabdus poinarii TaxID=40577 RepID=UPI0012FF0EE1|nr:phage antirepressor N-terminal domain-containing protein [Xenorhabdus poinarii]